MCGKIKVPGNPIELSGYGGNAALPPPVKGQHTTKVLQELGYTEKEIADMADQKVITV